MNKQRISSLDGLRGLAILLVIIFHTYARWPEYTPWTTEYKEIPIIKYGYLGVELFFLISGFVILMTLENCISFKEFIYKRWLRLFPAMLIGTILIYISADFLHERPAGKPNLIDALSGLTFIEPEILGKITGEKIKTIEGAFWSLFVEVKFYLLFGALYFTNKEKSLQRMTIIFLFTSSYKALSEASLINNILILDKIIFSALSLQHFGWFCIGALMYVGYKKNDFRYTLTSIAILPAAIISTSKIETGSFLACITIFCIFYLSLFHKKTSNIINSKIFIFLGFISYPLYLIHQNTIISLSIKSHNHFHWLNGLLTPIPGLIIIVIISYIIAKYGEPAIKEKIAALNKPK